MLRLVLGFLLLPMSWSMSALWLPPTGLSPLAFHLRLLIPPGGWAVMVLLVSLTMWASVGVPFYWMAQRTWAGPPSTVSWSTATAVKPRQSSAP